MSIKLTDTQLLMLSAAARRNNRCLVAAPNVKAAAGNPKSMAEGRLWVRFDSFATPSANDRYLRGTAAHGRRAAFKGTCATSAEDLCWHEPDRTLATLTDCTDTLTLDVFKKARS